MKTKQRNLYFTEGQIRKFVQKIYEDELNIAYQKPATGTISVDDMKQQLMNAKKSAPGAKVNLEVSGSDLGLSESVVTKKQLKEARLRYLKDNSVSVKKKDLK